MPKFFIERPIFAWVIAIFIMIAGVIGISKLPISQYPSVASPTITLTATYWCICNGNGRQRTVCD